jgi:hypothetical protein
MTGDVPYYGGRFTPAQAFAASHPRASHPRPPAPQPRPEPVAANPQAQLQALQQLLDSGVLTPAEFADIRSRVTP